MDETSLKAAIAAVDEIHRADPEGKELAYADSVERWLERLIGELDPVARLAARCQHLERWSLPRDHYPSDRVGYLKWRIAVHERQGERAEAILSAAGVDVESAALVRDLVAKHRVQEPLGQALEDAACLHFLAEQAADFLSDKDYDDAKAIDIIQKTWRKMSPSAHALALTIPMPGRLGDLVQRALA